jgi:all-trans-retinol dehydrogenase (NAD+)
VGFNEALRSELIAHGKNISVTTISPFYVDTGMFAGIKS